MVKNEKEIRVYQEYPDEMPASSCVQFLWISLLLQAIRIKPNSTIAHEVYTHLLLTPSVLSSDTFFTSFERSITDYPFSDKFNFSYDSHSNPLILEAVKTLQLHLENQQEWQHNFGLSNGTGSVIGKMFGVLVVKTEQDEIGYLSAFSGKLAGGNHHAGFVPPIFDGMEKGGFLNAGMNQLSNITEEINALGNKSGEAHQTQVQNLILLRKKHSISLQNKIFDQYHFLNQAGDQKSLRTIFADISYKNPPAGAGECAAPKLLQYAFRHKMKPLAMAEFWWGMSPKSNFWKHGHFYLPCREKCAPILAHMLDGMDMEANVSS